MSEVLIGRIAAEACGAAFRHIRPGAAGHDPAWSEPMRAAIEDDAQPTPIRQWMEDHHGQDIATVQFRVNRMSQEVREVWEADVTRRIDADYPKYVALISGDAHSSRRYYDGIRSVRTTDSMYIGYDIDMSTLLVYRVVPA